MVTIVIYAVAASNRHKCIGLKDPVGSLDAVGLINRRSLANHWVPLELTVLDNVNEVRSYPEIAVCDFGGLIAQVNVAEKLFGSTKGIELLPVVVDGQPWFFANCLNQVKSFDEARSRVLRGLTGEIFMIKDIIITDPAAAEYEIFTLESSNGATLLVTDGFRRRIDREAICGISFRKIGAIE